ncbi:MAG: C45 family peptidase, partial [Armatimonadetes bacterium]|nr:C45 family peptidase [Armatimonadota bacterium]
MNLRGGAIVLAALVSLVLALAAAAKALLVQATSFTPPPLRTDLLRDYRERASIARLDAYTWKADNLAVVVARGSPREMGRQYGAALRDPIRKGIQLYLIGKVVRDWNYPLDYQRRCASAMRHHIPAEYIEELEGVAEGSGVDFDMLLLMHTHADTVHYGHSWGRRDAAPGKDCTNFAVWGRWTTHGQLIHGRNLDWTVSTGVQTCACVYVGLPRQGVPFALVTYAGCIGGVTGMNAEGITFGEMTSSSSAETLDGMPLFFLCRQLLQYCRRIEDAERMVATYPPTTGWNFLVADGKVPTARAFEVDAKSVEIFGPADPAENDPPLHWPMQDCVRRTNHFVGREHQLRQCERYHFNYRLARSVLRSIDTWRRYASVSHWIAANPGKLDAREARALLQTAPVGGDGTLHSVVMEPAAQRMWVANASFQGGKGGPAWKEHYVYLD